MSFRPANEQHAIQVAAFAIGLNKPVAWNSVEALIKGPAEWRRSLPAMDLTHVVDVQVNPQSGAPVNRVFRGVEFSHKRPDGSAEWQLSVVGPELKVETTAYTRWNDVWAKAGDILINAAGLIGISEMNNDLRVASLTMVFSDVFFTSDAEPDFGELFSRSCDLLPPAIFQRGPVWHAYTGWFEERPEGNVLNQLNIDVRKGLPEGTLGAMPGDQIAVTVQHNQIYRPGAVLTLQPEEGLNAIENLLLQEIPLMHTYNKYLIRQLLVSGIQNLININVDN
ncbi:hypothetical protein AB8Z38_04605 [Bradyrhizobium sp. LLZ17]|uniref:TIGR04255 family protein n=1 Tax=Bradyrhizobium sp. LLZ17 TaxID=3239388 RepID=A0AB39XR62_9BRAD